jgi:hypothetical protein
LTCWLDSDIRHELIRIGRKNFAPYEYKNWGTGLEGWFDKKRSGKPESVICCNFGLYPTVMVESLLFSHFRFMEIWTFANQIFVCKIISCSLLTWVVMPFVTKLLKFRLKPQQNLIQINLIGTSLVFVGYGLMISIFNFLS